MKRDTIVQSVVHACMDFFCMQTQSVYLYTYFCESVWFVRVCRREGGISQTGPIGMRVSLRDTSTTEERERKSTTEREHRAETEVFYTQT